MLTYQNLSRFDLNLLTVFSAIEEHQHVGRAAKALGLSQPAVSHALNRLRSSFDDALFIKSPKGMVPTERAKTLSQPIRQTLTRLEEIFKRDELILGTVDRHFRIFTTDLIEFLVAPKLISILEDQAPNVKVNFVSSGFSFPQSQIISGECDLTIAGFFENIPDNYYQQEVLVDHYLLAGHRKHPIFKKEKIKTSDYCQHRHLLIAPGGQLKGKLDSILAQKKMKRQISVGTSNFLVSGHILANSGLLLTAPSTLLRQFSNFLPLNTRPLPFKAPPIKIIQVWHPKDHADQLHQWIRTQIRQIIKELIPS